MKDKILPHDYDQSSIEELTERANKLIDSLENEKDLNSSAETFQELLRLNSIIEKKFYKNLKTIGEKTKKKIEDIIKINEKKT